MKQAMCISSTMGFVALSTRPDLGVGFLEAAGEGGDATTTVDPDAVKYNSELPQFTKEDTPKDLEGREGYWQWEDFPRYFGEDVPASKGWGGKWEWKPYGKDGAKVEDDSHCPENDWCWTNNDKQGMCLNGFCQEICIQATGGCTSLLKEQVVGCSYDPSRPAADNCFVDEDGCGGLAIGNPCRAFDGKRGVCLPAIESANGKPLELPMHGVEKTVTLAKGPLMCHVCRQLGERALSEDHCCTSSFLTSTESAVTGRAGVCAGCKKNSECPSEFPVCDLFSQQCKCSRDSCWEGFRCFNHRNIEVRHQEAGERCACAINDGQPLYCKAWETCNDGRCVPK